MSSRSSPSARRARNSSVLARSSSSESAAISSASSLMGGTSSASWRTRLPSPAFRILLNTVMSGCTLPVVTVTSIGLRVLTWSFTPHLPAAVSVGHAGSTRLSGDATTHFTGSPGDRSGHLKAGLTSKPRHAQRLKDALRGSFRPRLASTFNHRTTRSPGDILDRGPLRSGGGSPIPHRVEARAPASQSAPGHVAIRSRSAIRSAWRCGDERSASLVRLARAIRLRYG